MTVQAMDAMGNCEHEEGNNLVAKWHVFTAEYAGFGAQHRLFYLRSLAQRVASQ